jgi:thymidylate synthase
MRSSDIWLGLPYDVFNFSMLSHLVCAKFNSKVMVNSQIKPGVLHLTAASSHLYEENFGVANDCIRNPGQVYVPSDTPDLMWQDQEFLMNTLRILKDQPPTSKDRWFK